MFGAVYGRRSVVCMERLCSLCGRNDQSAGVLEHLKGRLVYGKVW